MTDNIANRKLRIIHPFLFGIYPVIFLYSHNTGEVFLSQTLMPLTVCFASWILLWCTLGLICKSKNKSAVLTSLSFVFFFFYGHVFSLVKEGHIGGWKIGLHTYFLPVWMAVFFALIFIVFKTKKPLLKLTKIMNIIAVCLVAMSVANVVILQAQALLHTQGDSMATVSPDSESIKAGKIISKPNIYYIILDAHVRADITKKYLGYDSSPFILRLEDNGFFVADKSRSNYTHTVKSVPSSLNFKYLARMDTERDYTPAERKTYYRNMVVNNRLFKFLKEQGYSLVSVSTNSAFTHFKDSDIFLSGFFTSNAFTNELINGTPLIALKKLAKARFYMHYRRLKYTLNFLPEVAKFESPHIFFAHIMCPHLPFVLDEYGNFKASGDTLRLQPGNSDVSQLKADYLGQLKYVDRKIADAIDGILANSKEEPIIIVQGDHGIRWLDEQDGLESTYSILNALYLPGYDYSQLDNEITPVNTFRFILNHYFGTELEILENKTFINGSEIKTDF